MLQWALAFLILALVAAFFGFGGIAAASAGIAKILFYVFVVVFAITLVGGILSGRRVIR
ncbi:MAG TPA: DUF1328 family protein [Gemmatimonadales bacterium]|nr:DUF1328 family protein [Gemmatimonadales bacterium]